MTDAALDGVRIVPFSADLAEPFRLLNEEWIERYFKIEPEDAEVLGDPAGQILAPGGEVFFALLDGEAVGTCAVRPVDERRVELSKMAVSPRAQGRGIGRMLLNRAVSWFEARPEPVLFLESHRSLGPALKLYETAGFRHVSRPDESHYERCDVYMEWAASA